MSGLFELGDDIFLFFLSWLDFGCLCKLDIATGNADERLLWRHSLHTMGSEAVDEYKHTHSSIRWLIRRGVRATRIRIRGTKLERDRITDQTFAGVGSLFTSNAGIDDRNPTLINGGAYTLKNHSTVRYRLRSREITVETNTCASVRRLGCHHLTSIDLSGCSGISDIGVSAIAACCHHLTSINLKRCPSISDIGVSAIAERCRHLTSIDLRGCGRISDIGVSALAEGCHHLTSIKIRYCDGVSDIGVSALAAGCCHLISIKLGGRISDIGLSALTERCHQLTSINLSFCDGISDIGVSAI